VHSDALPNMKAGLAAEGAQYHAIQTASGRQAAFFPQFGNVSTLPGNLNTAISGTYHAFDFAKCAGRCLAEVQYRFNRRLNLASLLSRWLRAAATTLA
jgi:hypothetical protein